GKEREAIVAGGGCFPLTCCGSREAGGGQRCSCTEQKKDECCFSNMMGQKQVHYLYRYIYDQTEIMCFDSDWNSQEILAVKQIEVDTFCQFNYGVAAAGRVVGRRGESLEGCPFSFYPQEIEVHWLKNGQRATEGVFYGEELHNGDWMYQTQVMLEDTPQRGDVYTCQVEHASLQTPITVQWEPWTSVSVRSKVWTGVMGALLGVVFVAMGLSLYLRSKKGKGPLPAGPHLSLSLSH
uniref:Ig-like domain-containing protein n=1 Tax=Varanus komodoensis TaxID=61221 RepID=A0A8D2L603_VARKO